MRGINVALELTDVDEIKKEIDLRNGLIAVMVGRLYPRILAAENARLWSRISQLNNDHYRYPMLKG